MDDTDSVAHNEPERLLVRRGWEGGSEGVATAPTRRPVAADGAQRWIYDVQRDVRVLRYPLPH